MIHKADLFIQGNTRRVTRAARRTDLEEFVKEEGEPVGEHLLRDRLRPEETSDTGGGGGEKKKSIQVAQWNPHHV